MVKGKNRKNKKRTGNRFIDSVYGGRCRSLLLLFAASSRGR